MEKFKLIFGAKKVAIGVIHLQALAGTPRNELNPKQIIDSALQEAKTYRKAGIDSLIIENMHDVPYLKNEIGHEISTLMTIVSHEVKKETRLPLGIQILAGANRAALATAKSSGADFIRAEGFVFGHIADEGYIDAQAGKLLRYRKEIDAQSIAIFTDIKKKHSSHAITQDISLLETAKAAEFFLSDGVVITGGETGSSASLAELESLKGHLKIPVFVGSGITIDNFKSYVPLCDAMIIGSHFKEDGLWSNALNYDRVALFMDAFNKQR